MGNNDAKTADSLVLTGKTEVTAAKALAGMGYLTVKNDLVLNGAVNEFLGRYEQTAGNVVLNTDTFFNGVTTSSEDDNGTFIKGGSFTAEKSLYDTSDKKARLFEINNGAVVNLAGMHIGDLGQDLTYAKSTTATLHFRLSRLKKAASSVSIKARFASRAPRAIKVPSVRRL